MGRNQLSTIKIQEFNQLPQLLINQAGEKKSKHLEDVNVTINKLGINERIQNLVSYSENAYSSQAQKNIKKNYRVKLSLNIF